MNIRDVRDIVGEEGFCMIQEQYHPATDSTSDILLIDDQFTLEQMIKIAKAICEKEKG